MVDALATGLAGIHVPLERLMVLGVEFTVEVGVDETLDLGAAKVLNSSHDFFSDRSPWMGKGMTSADGAASISGTLTPFPSSPKLVGVNSTDFICRKNRMSKKTKKDDRGGGTAVVEKPAPPIRKNAPLYHVILHNDDNHTYEYVVRMLMELFGKTVEGAFKHACEVDAAGVTIVETTNLERAELKRDQIKADGKDPLLAHSPGSMFASIEPAP